MSSATRVNGQIVIECTECGSTGVAGGLQITTIEREDAVVARQEYEQRIQTVRLAWEQNVKSMTADPRNFDAVAFNAAQKKFKEDLANLEANAPSIPTHDEIIEKCPWCDKPMGVHVS